MTRLNGDDAVGAYTRLVAVAHTLGYSVEEDHLDGSRNGDCSFRERLIWIEAANDPAQQVKTLAHEIAHAILHESFDGSRDLAELEAESVAYIVCSDMGLDSSAYSFGYVATWAGGGACVPNEGGRTLAIELTVSVPPVSPTRPLDPSADDPESSAPPQPAGSCF